jgi:hypothetical protein
MKEGETTGKEGAKGARGMYMYREVTSSWKGTPIGMCRGI